MCNRHTDQNNVIVAATDDSSCGKFTLFEEFSSEVREVHLHIVKGYSLRGSSNFIRGQALTLALISINNKKKDFYKGNKIQELGIKCVTNMNLSCCSDIITRCKVERRPSHFGR